MIGVRRKTILPLAYAPPSLSLSLSLSARCLASWLGLEKGRRKREEGRASPFIFPRGRVLVRGAQDFDGGFSGCHVGTGEEGGRKEEEGGT